jgi:hypothetical protein
MPITSKKSTVLAPRHFPELCSAGGFNGGVTPGVHGDRGASRLSTSLRFGLVGTGMKADGRSRIPGHEEPRRG